MTTTIEVPAGTSALNITQESDRILFEFVPKFKEGDFVYEDGRIMIVKNHPNNYYALIYPKLGMNPIYNGSYAPTMSLSSLSLRYATEGEKQLLIDAMEKDGKRWNAEKLRIEDIPQRKFNPGDKVKLKDGILDKGGESPYFVTNMYIFIDKVLTVGNYNSEGYILLNETDSWVFAEDWLELYSDEPIVGELAIFWDFCKEHSHIRLCTQRIIERYCDHAGILWENAIKFESKEQFLEHIKD